MRRLVVGSAGWALTPSCPDIATCLMMFCPVMLCSIVGVELERVLTTGLEVTTVGAVRAVTEMVPGAVTVMAGRGMLAAACVFTGIVTTWVIPLEVVVVAGILMCVTMGERDWVTMAGEAADGIAAEAVTIRTCGIEGVEGRVVFLTGGVVTVVT